MYTTVRSDAGRGCTGVRRGALAAALAWSCSLALAQSAVPLSTSLNGPYSFTDVDVTTTGPTTLTGDTQIVVTRGRLIIAHPINGAGAPGAVGAPCGEWSAAGSAGQNGQRGKHLKLETRIAGEIRIRATIDLRGGRGGNGESACHAALVDHCSNPQSTEAGRGGRGGSGAAGGELWVRAADNLSIRAAIYTLGGMGGDGGSGGGNENCGGGGGEGGEGGQGGDAGSITLLHAARTTNPTHSAARLFRLISIVESGLYANGGKGGSGGSSGPGANGGSAQRPGNGGLIYVSGDEMIIDYSNMHTLGGGAGLPGPGGPPIHGEPRTCQGGDCVAHHGQRPDGEHDGSRRTPYCCVECPGSAGGSAGKAQPGGKGGEVIVVADSKRAVPNTERILSINELLIWTDGGHGSGWNGVHKADGAPGGVMLLCDDPCGGRIGFPGGDGQRGTSGGNAGKVSIKALNDVQAVLFSLTVNARGGIGGFGGDGGQGRGSWGPCQLPCDDCALDCSTAKPGAAGAGGAGGDGGDFHFIQQSPGGALYGGCTVDLNGGDGGNGGNGNVHNGPGASGGAPGVDGAPKRDLLNPAGGAWIDVARTQTSGAPGANGGPCVD